MTFAPWGLDGVLHIERVRVSAVVQGCPVIWACEGVAE